MNNSESTAENHFILDYLPLQTNLTVLKTKRRKNHKAGKLGEKARYRDSKRQRDRPRETDYSQKHCGESLT